MWSQTQRCQRFLIGCLPGVVANALFSCTGWWDAALLCLPIGWLSGINCNLFILFYIFICFHEPSGTLAAVSVLLGGCSWQWLGFMWCWVGKLGLHMQSRSADPLSYLPGLCAIFFFNGFKIQWCCWSYRTLATHAAGAVLFSSIMPYGPLSPPGGITEHTGRSKARALLGVTQNLKNI